MGKHKVCERTFTHITHIFILKQVCISVGCVPPACWPIQRVGSATAPQVCPMAGGGWADPLPTVDRRNDTHLWKNYLATSDPAAGLGGQETWNLCGRLWRPFFYLLFVQGWGGPWPPQHPLGSATACPQTSFAGVKYGRKFSPTLLWAFSYIFKL